MKMETTYQNLWDTVKAVLRAKFVTISTYIRKTARSQPNDASKSLLKMTKPKINRKKVKIRVEVNEVETKILLKGSLK